MKLIVAMQKKGNRMQTTICDCGQYKEKNAEMCSLCTSEIGMFPPPPGIQPKELEVLQRRRALELRNWMSSHGYDGREVVEVLKSLYAATQPAAAPDGASFPERDQSKPAEQQGLFRKFDVRRTDGSDQPGGKHHDCRYFVLDLVHDTHAPAAMRAYAGSCRATHPQLADDIEAEFAAPSIPAAMGADGPLQLPLELSRDEMLKYYSDYANCCAKEALKYQKRIFELEGSQFAPPVPASAPIEAASFPAPLATVCDKPLDVHRLILMYRTLAEVQRAQDAIRALQGKPEAPKGEGND